MSSRSLIMVSMASSSVINLRFCPFFGWTSPWYEGSWTNQVLFTRVRSGTLHASVSASKKRPSTVKVGKRCYSQSCLIL